MGDTNRRVSLRQLELAFDVELSADRRAAAEIAYALAVRYRNEDVDGVRRFDIAKAWARRSIELLDSLPSNTQCQVASTCFAVGGVEIPGMLHSGVVRQRLGDVLF